MTKRILVVSTTDDELFKNFTYEFDSDRMSDSEAFRHLICTIDPGTDYAIEFRNYYECLHSPTMVRITSCECRCPVCYSVAQQNCICEKCNHH